MVGLLLGLNKKTDALLICTKYNVLNVEYQKKT